MLTIEHPPYPGFDEVFPSLLRAEASLNLRIVLVGAGARNLWMEVGQEMGHRRSTKDIDLAVMATDHVHYQQLRQYFVDHEGFTLSPRFELSLFTPRGTPVDLLPYGPIEENHEIMLGRMAKAIVTPNFRTTV